MTKCRSENFEPALYISERLQRAIDDFAAASSPDSNIVWLPLDHALMSNSSWMAGGKEHAECRRGGKCEADLCRQSRNAIEIIEQRHHKLLALATAHRIQFLKGSVREELLEDGPYAVIFPHSGIIKLGDYGAALRWIRIMDERYIIGKEVLIALQTSDRSLCRI